MREFGDPGPFGLKVEENGVRWRPQTSNRTAVGGVDLMFLGTHFPKLDDKGRLVLPAKFPRWSG